MGTLSYTPSSSPVVKLVAPGPLVAMTTPSLPVYLALAAHIEAAFPSVRVLREKACEKDKLVRRKDVMKGFSGACQLSTGVSPWWVWLLSSDYLPYPCELGMVTDSIDQGDHSPAMLAEYDGNPHVSNGVGDPLTDVWPAGIFFL